MIRRCLLLAVVCLLPTSNSLFGQDRPKMDQADIDRLVKELSNWGRWGADDQLGALNLITPQKRLEAVALVKRGVSVSLARNAETKEAADNPSPFKHVMLRSGSDGGDWATDQYAVNYHGLAHTHMDSLCHLFYKDKMYNGFTREQVTATGADKLSILNAKHGIMTRGILIDIPRLRGKSFLEPGDAIYPEELDEWETETGTKVRPGDVVFIRTGRWARRKALGPWNAQQDGLAGLHASCAKWLKQRDVAMLGSDAASDVMPSRVTGVAQPIHILTLHAMGMHIFDNCDLEAVAASSGEYKQWEFLLTASPIPVEGGTGSPLNPIATY